ncbi:hypothetical protein ACFFV7_15605 [Nonomuraea spiralis]|uniref:Uncharacterized protein n=1 Tax=Nonomuraea spiralis TaxID=46182 RepID=A0ABV5IEV0_9ACTN|nr:hypothetical protein [Nonomuraea spiralis]GGT33139.1 hypothetical protein GCM10010176_092160 [Nonomuraea spiralis]
MSGDLVSVAQELSPYVTAAVGAYGGAVLAKANEQAADATVGWGRTILQRIFGVTAAEEEVPEAVAELAADPDNTDLQAVLRVQIGRLLTADPELAAQVRTLLEQAEAATGRTGTTTVTASGQGAVAAGRDITGPVTTGDHSPITQA